LTYPKETTNIYSIAKNIWQKIFFQAATLRITETGNIRNEILTKNNHFYKWDTFQFLTHLRSLSKVTLGRSSW